MFRTIIGRMVVAVLIAAVAPAAWSVPGLINYQGRLTDAQGQPETGAVTLSFGVWSQESGGNLLWGEQDLPASLVDGTFNVMLGQDTQGRSLGEVLAKAGSGYLQIRVNGGPAIVPRQQILSAPYALVAEYANKPLFTTVTKNTNYTMNGTEDVVFVDGSTEAFTLKLPPAAIPGSAPYYGEKPITIKRTDGTLANVITIAGTIDGESDWKLHTKGETYRIVRNGSEWKLLDHETRTAASSPENLSITSISGVDPSNSNTTRPKDAITWWREGQYAHLRIEYRQSSAGSTGTGVYRIAMPQGLVIDTARAEVTPNPSGITISQTYALESIVQFRCYTSYTIGTTGGNIVPVDASGFAIYLWYKDDNGNHYPRGWGYISGVAVCGLADDPIDVLGFARVPIAGWKD